MVNRATRREHAPTSRPAQPIGNDIDRASLDGERFDRWSRLASKRARNGPGIGGDRQRQTIGFPSREPMVNSTRRKFMRKIPGKKLGKILGSTALALSLLGASAMSAAAEDTVKIGYIDPLSGGGASVGEVGLKTFQFLADELNAKGGIQGKKVEIVPLDNKTNPQESLIQAQKAIDAGIRFLTQGNGSAVASALTDFVSKYNERNPGKEVLYFNYAAVDPILTNAKCSFWHFRWDANSDIKMEALTNYMKTVPSIKNVYLINQDYSFGESVRTSAKAMLAAKRPDIKIVGDELHPLLKITDFAPYIAKIKASGADTVITGNWGQDFALLLKAAADAGLKVNWFTYYAGGTGGPTAIKQANLDHQVFQITEGIANIDNAPSQEFEKALRAKYDFSLFYPRAVNEMRMLAAAAEKAKSIDPVKVAAALEGLEFEVFDGGKGFMRKDDHQFFQPIYISSFGDRTAKEPFDEEKTGWGWKMVAKIDTPATELPTTCKMERP
jgi:branched-chain amino acid transport system substrate-binding protein